MSWPSSSTCCWRPGRPATSSRPPTRRHAHEWEVFKEIPLPEGKYLVPGVIDSTNNYVEHPRAVAQRLINYGRLVGRDRIMAGTDCGFGTFVGQANTVPSVVWDKFRSLAEGSRIAWAELA